MAVASQHSYGLRGVARILVLLFKHPRKRQEQTLSQHKAGNKAQHFAVCLHFLPNLFLHSRGTFLHCSRVDAWYPAANTELSLEQPELLMATTPPT